MASPSVQTPDTGPSTTSGPGAKRRKIRKGTFSCWECKHRKKRCHPAGQSGGACRNCQRHNLPCIGQEFTDTTSDVHDATEQHLTQIEGLVQRVIYNSDRLVDKQGDQATSACQNTRRLDSTGEYLMQQSLASQLAITEDLLSRRRSLSAYLHSTLPSPHLTAEIMHLGQPPFEMLQSPLTLLKSDDSLAIRVMRHPEALTEAAHPILLARVFLQLALCTQHLDLKPKEQRPDVPLDGLARDRARRYVSFARFATKQDILVNSAEGIETLLLEGACEVTFGNFRDAALLFRRAFGIAQLIGLRSMAEQGDTLAQILWLRLVYHNCHVALIVGRQFTGDLQVDGIEQEDSPPYQIMDRHHINISHRITARNERMTQQKSPLSSARGRERDLEETRAIDSELKKIARAVPANWWTISEPTSLRSNEEAIVATSTLICQTHHHYLVLLLHAPILYEAFCRQSPPTRPGSEDELYSKLAAISASREVVRLFAPLCRFTHIPTSFRGSVFKAKMAAAIVLLAHIDSHRYSRDDVLEHQRPRDLNSIVELIGCIEKEGISASQEDAKFLRRLMAMEGDAASGAAYMICLGKNAAPNPESKDDSIEQPLSVAVPYFGPILISRAGKPSAELGITDLDGHRASTPSRSSPRQHASSVDMQSEAFVTSNAEPQSGFPCAPWLMDCGFLDEASLAFDAVRTELTPTDTWQIDCADAGG